MIHVSGDAAITKAISDCDIVIVGAGFFGITLAERLANELNLKIFILESRDHFGGNAYSYVDESTGIEIHKYGSHLFHTSNQKVWEYVNRFTDFNEYRHTVVALHNKSYYPMPINLQTISLLFDKALTPDEARQKIEDDKPDLLDTEDVENFETKALSTIGHKLYNAFIKNYTSKQWQTDPANLPAEIIQRLPVRFNFNSRYFQDKYEGLPLNGYEAWFRQMLVSDNIKLALSTDFFDYKQQINGKKKLIYTGPIDRYFSYQFGLLGWRTLDFKIETLDTPDYQGTSVVNYVDADPEFTRVHEFKHFHPEREAYDCSKTVIMKEFSRFASKVDEPYYPINSVHDKEILIKYRGLVAKEKNVIFGGRLGSYKYLDMHMAIASALQIFETTDWTAIE
jgi:UDP-galactopyranose mutase